VRKDDCRHGVKEKAIKDIKAKLGSSLRVDEPMSRHTTIGLGGKARMVALPRTIAQVVFLVRYAIRENMRYVVIGRGSNLLVRDGGFEGLVIKIAGNLAKVTFNAGSVRAEAGASLSSLARRAVKMQRSGLEFAVGIPGSVGGAVKMNAGAFGREIADVLLRVRLIDGKGELVSLRPGRGDFTYRKSHLPRGAVVLSASFECRSGSVDRVMLAKSLGRRDTQPLESRSFGSTFVNPPGDFAGRLIEACGLKGKRIGGAMISSKHANFILNVGTNTRAGDVEELMKLAKKKVKEKFGINLKPEVVVIGEK